MLENRRRARNPFAKRLFSDEVILVSVGWHLRFKLSYRDLAQILAKWASLSLLAQSFAGLLVILLQAAEAGMRNEFYFR